MKKFVAAIAALLAVAGVGISTVNWSGPVAPDTVNWSANMSTQATVNWNGYISPDTVNWS